MMDGENPSPLFLTFIPGEIIDRRTTEEEGRPQKPSRLAKSPTSSVEMQKDGAAVGEQPPLQ